MEEEEEEEEQQQYWTLNHDVQYNADANTDSTE
jgi:hypothetical protein